MDFLQTQPNSYDIVRLFKFVNLMRRRNQFCYRRGRVNGHWYRPGSGCLGSWYLFDVELLFFYFLHIHLLFWLLFLLFNYLGRFLLLRFRLLFHCGYRILNLLLINTSAVITLPVLMGTNKYWWFQGHLLGSIWESWGKCPEQLEFPELVLWDFEFLQIWEFYGDACQCW